MGLERWEDQLFCHGTPNPNPPNSGWFWKQRDELQERWKREIKLCERDAPERCAELKKLWQEYLERRTIKVKKFLKDSEL